MRFDIVPAEKQKVWKWPAAANFVLSGAGSGLYVMTCLLFLLSQKTAPRGPLVFSDITAVIFVMIGFFFVSLELGRLASARYSLRRVSSSWISREVLFGGVFVASAGGNLVFGSKTFGVAAALAAAGILVSQGFILKAARSVTAWNVRWMPALILVSGLHSGYGLSLVIHAAAPVTSVTYMVVGIALNLINLILWGISVTSATVETNPAARSLGSHKFRIVTLGLGHITPLLLITLCSVLWDHNAGSVFCRPVLFLTGIGMLTGSALQKNFIVTKAGYKTGLWFVN